MAKRKSLLSLLCFEAAPKKQKKKEEIANLSTTRREYKINASKMTKKKKIMN